MVALDNESLQMQSTISIDRRRLEQISALAAAAGVPVGQFVDRLIGDAFSARFPDEMPPGLRVQIVEQAACHDMAPAVRSGDPLIKIELDWPGSSPVSIFAYAPSALDIAARLEGLVDGSRKGGIAIPVRYGDGADRVVIGRQGNGIVAMYEAIEGIPRRGFSLTRGLLADYADAILRVAVRAARPAARRQRSPRAAA